LRSPEESVTSLAAAGRAGVYEGAYQLVMSISILTTGESLGGFRIIDVIGLGGMAIVYRAEQVSLGRRVALKVLAPQLTGDEAFRERFRREGRSVAALDHPHILDVFDSGEADGQLFLAMRLVEGETLGDRMSAVGLSAAQTSNVLTAIASALDCAHDAGVVHRDVKPQNILLGVGGHPYLADFGVAKAAEGGLGLTATGGFVGSVNYAAPEQIRGERVTAASDIYSLTAVLFQCLTGRVPYPRDTDVSVMHAHLNEPPPTLRDHTPAAPALDRVLARGMAKEPEQRYPTAGALLTDALAALGDLSAAQRTVTPAFTPVPQSGLSDPVGVPEPETVEDRIEPMIAVAQSSAPDEQAVPAPPPAAAVSGATEIVSPAERALGRSLGERTIADGRRERPAPSETPAPGRGRRYLVGGVALLAVLVAGVLAVVVGSLGTHHQAKATAAVVPTRVVHADPWTLQYRAPWTRTRQAPAAIRTLVGPGTVTLHAGAASLTAGVLKRSAAIPGGSPPSLGKPDSSNTTRVDGHLSREYVLRGMAVFVLPAAAADLVLVCKGAGSTLTACERLARSARVSDVQLLAPGVNSALARRVGSLVHADVTALRQLGHLRGSFGARAKAARRLARADGVAAGAIRHLAAPARYRPPLSKLRTALIREQAALLRLAAAASAGRRESYARSASSVMSLSGSVAAGVKGLHPARLTSASIRRLALAAAPQPPRHRVTPATTSAQQTTPLSTTGTYTPTPTTPTTPAITTPSQTSSPPTQTQPTHSSSGGGVQTVTSPFK
jgi:serine/threonine protein kinase